MRVQLVDSLPDIVPFEGRKFDRFVALLDWDHYLPSRNFVLHLHGFYDEHGLADFEAAFAARLAEIKQRDLYPEFDVRDFAELPADESYTSVVAAQRPVVESLSFVSPWRRTVAADASKIAVDLVRKSPEFLDVYDEDRHPNFLGDLEAAAWVPPCESKHDAWTVDVWWLTSFDGRTGRGWSFLVDISADSPGVIMRREFAVRTR